MTGETGSQGRVTFPCRGPFSVLPSSATLSDKNQLFGAPLIGPPDPPPAVVGSEIGAPQYFNIYWDSTWDADNGPFLREALDSFLQGLTGSTYFSGLAEYGISSPSFLGSTLPNSACTQAAPSSVGFYDPVNPSIIGFLNCELGSDTTIPQGDNVIYNIILPQSSVERDAIAQLLGVAADCDGGAVSWHFYGTGVVLGGLLGGLVGVSIGDPVAGAIGGFLAGLASQGGPFYTIASTSSSRGQFTNNLVHEMLEAASDPMPPISVIADGGNGEIADNCSHDPASSPSSPAMRARCRPGPSSRSGPLSTRRTARSRASRASATRRTRRSRPCR